MPYIDTTRRNVIHQFDQDRGEELIVVDEIDTVGELNFAISALANRYIQNHGLTYTNASAARGAMLDAAAEFYRIVMVPFENLKMAENGPVYGPFNGGGDV